MEAPNAPERSLSAPTPLDSPRPSQQASFPQVLHHILSNDRFANIAWWHQSGSFFYIRPEAFAETAMHEFFGGTKFGSFTRKLNRWGFRRANVTNESPKDTVVYAHELFHRYKPMLLVDMIKRGTKRPTKPSKTVKTLPRPVIPAGRAPVGTAANSVAATHSQLQRLLALQAQRNQQQQQSLLSCTILEARLGGLSSLLQQQQQPPSLALLRSQQLDRQLMVAQLRRRALERIDCAVLGLDVSSPLRQQGGGRLV